MPRPSPALLAVLLTAACAGRDRPASGWSPVEEAELDARQETQLAQAASARDAMMEVLLGTLLEELASGTTASAIAVCRDRAPEIARAVGAEQGVGIGRTSWKLRNPANRGPEWTEPLLADRPAQTRLVANADGRLGATFPIRVADACLVCHGRREALDPEVRTALAELYPADAATGFEAGDLRGWFWVEVPR